MATPCYRCEKEKEEMISIFCVDCYNRITLSEYNKLREDKLDELRDDYQLKFLHKLLIIMLVVFSAILFYPLYKILLTIFGPIVIWIISYKLLRRYGIARELDRLLPPPSDPSEEKIVDTKLPDKREKKAITGETFSSLVEDVHTKYVKKNDSP